MAPTWVGKTVTGRTGDLGKFNVPGLRNVAASAPYMHDGSLVTLEDVVDRPARHRACRCRGAEGQSYR